MNLYTTSDALAQVTENGIGLGSIFDKLKIDIESYKNIIDDFKKIDLEDDIFKLDDGKANWDAIAKAIEGCDETALSYFKTLDDGNGTINNQSASVEGLGAHLKATGQSFNFAAIKATLLNTALNAGIFLVASVAIQGIAKALDNYIHRNEILLEKAEEAQTRISDLNDEYESHKKTVDELGASYEKLSKGVDTTTNRNLSLSDEDYDEYLRITNELADTFPQLRTTIDENGNSIIQFSDKTKSATENLMEFLEAEQQTANYKIAQELPDLFGEVSVKSSELDAVKQKYDSLSESTSKYTEELNQIGSITLGDNYSVQTDTSESGIQYYNALSSAVQRFTDTLPAAQKEFFDFTKMVETNADGISTIYIDFSLLDDKQKENLQKIIDEEFESLGYILSDKVGDFKTELNDAQAQFDSAWNDFRGNLINAMHSRATYQGLDDTSKQLADILVGNLSPEVAKQMDDNNPYQWINDNIISQLAKIDDPKLLTEFQSKIQKLFEFKDGDIDIVSFAEELQKWLNDNEFHIDITPIIANEQEAKDRLNSSINGIAKNSSTNVIDLNELLKLKEYTKDFDEAQIQMWLNVTSGIQGAQNSIDAYERALKDVNEVKLDPMSNSNLIDSFSVMKTNLKSISDIISSINDKEPFDLSLLDTSNFEGFEGLEEELSKFINTISSAPDNIESAKQATDDLIDAYIRQEKFVSVLRDGNKDLAISMLEQIGVTNAAIIVEEELEKQEADLFLQKQDLASIINDENAFTEERITTLLNEAEANGIARDSIIELIAQEILLNEQGLDLSSQIDELYRLANAAGIATSSLGGGSSASNVDPYAHGGSYDAAENTAYQLKSGLNSRSKAKYDPTKLSPAKNSGGSKKEKDTTQEFDWIEKAIKKVEEDLSRLDKVSSSAYSSISEKNEALAESISKINEEIDLQQQAYERYMEKAESVGLSDEYKNLVQNGAVDIESITDDDLKEAIKNYEQWYDKAKEAQDKIDDLYDDAKDKHVEAYELEAGEIEKLREDQAITEREYLDTMLALYEKYYAGQADFANQAKEAKLKYLKEEKDYLNTVAEAASSLLDDQIDETEDEKDKARKVYEDEIAGIEESIKAKEKEKDAIQLKIDALKDEGDELDRQKNLLDALKSKEEALYALERAKSQRSQMLYKDGQMVWNVDDSKIREANQNVDDAQAAVDKAERDIRIANLQAEIDGIQKGIDALEEEKAGLEALADESDAFFDKKIADMKEYQNEWKKALEIEERAVAFENLKAMFGDDAVEQILAHNITLLTGWKQEYIDTMAAIDLAANGSVGSITSEWGELANISVDMDNAMQLAGLSVDGLSDKAEKLGSAVSETADASERAGAALGMTDISNAGEQFHNVGLSAQNAQEQINGITEKLNALTSDVQNYTIPAINSEQFTASLGTADGTGGILGDLNTFIERFREICSSIPSIWDAAMSSMGGVGAANGEDVSYGYLFKPLVNAMDAAGQEIDAKLKEYTESWTQFNTDLGGIIVVIKRFCNTCS